MESEQDLKQAVMRALDGLPPEKVAVVLDFTLFLKKWRPKGRDQIAAVQESPALKLRTVPAAQLDGVTGLVAWGGDAVVDAERLYEDQI